jgi:UDP-N-acetylmuramate dehydrogenase
MSLDTAATALTRALGDHVTRDAPIADFTTYRLGGPAAVLVQVIDDDALRAVASVIAHERPELLVIGRGSNLLVADRGFPGVALVLGGRFDDVDLLTDPGRVGVRAGASAPLPVVARRSAAAGLTGLEFLVGIPGSVGGAVRMNAGGHGREIAEVLTRAAVADLSVADAPVADRDVESLAFGYRTSALGPYDVVVAADLRAETADVAAAEARVAEIVRWRREHQPGGANAGSVFRNPPGDSAGRLIDATGLKGFRVGGAVVSPKHANFFQAETGATADDVHRLVATVRVRVADATGVTLEPELRMIGFDPVSRTQTEVTR